MLLFPHASLTGLGIIVLALLIAAALFLTYEIGKIIGKKRATDKFPEAKKVAVQRSRSVLGGMFAEQLAPYLPNFPFSPTEANFIGAPIEFLVFRGMNAAHRESDLRRSEIRIAAFPLPSLTSTWQPNPRYKPKATKKEPRPGEETAEVFLV